jgi:hypothetical protein
MTNQRPRQRAIYAGRVPSCGRLSVSTFIYAQLTEHARTNVHDLGQRRSERLRKLSGAAPRVSSIHPEQRACAERRASFYVWSARRPNWFRRVEPYFVTRLAAMATGPEAILGGLPFVAVGATARTWDRSQAHRQRDDGPLKAKHRKET